MKNTITATRRPVVTISATYSYSVAAQQAQAKLNAGTIDEQSHDIGARNCEPLLVILDCLLKYAQAYRQRFDGPLSEDHVLGVYWLDGIKGIHGLLNGDGAVAMRSGRTTDSKSNGVCEEVFWAAMNAAGFTEADL